MQPPKTIKARDRLDRVMVARGLAASRARAQDLIRRGLVQVEGRTERATGHLVAPGQAVDVAISHARACHVSRGSEKLAAGLAHFRFDARGRVALDIGASTGGFTRVLLDAGAARVHAVDVGHGQMHASLREDTRVRLLEDCDARDLDASLLPDPVGAIVADVSFISLTKALPAALQLAAPGAWLIALVKPQFEAGRAALSKRGIVRDPLARERAVAAVAAFVAGQRGWRVEGTIPSPITGGSGNQEYLLGAIHDGK